MAIKKIDHIGIATRDMECVLSLYRDLLGLEVTDTVESKAMNMAFLPVGETQIELLEPVDPESAIGKYIERRGEGIHHICFEVDDIEATLQRLEAAGLELIDKTPRLNAHGKKVHLSTPNHATGCWWSFTSSHMPSNRNSSLPVGAPVGVGAVHLPDDHSPIRSPCGAGPSLHGSGKGKTSAALGLALRAAGHNMRVHIVQFLKGIEYGELRSLSRVPNITVVQVGEARWVDRGKPPKKIANGPEMDWT